MTKDSISIRGEVRERKKSCSRRIQEEIFQDKETTKIVYNQKEIRQKRGDKNDQKELK